METIDISLVRIEDADPPVVGLLYTPAQEASQAVVLAHGYGGSKQDMTSLGQALCDAGYHVFIPDIRGHRLGGTSGCLSSLDDVAEDLEASVRFTKYKARAEKLTLCGHSMSGAAGAKTAALREAVDALILLGNGLRPMGQDMPPEVVKLITVRSKYVDGIEGMEIRHQVQSMLREYMGKVSPKPVLIVAGSSDNINTEQRCRDLLDMTDGPKSLMLVDSDHFRLPLCSSEPVLQWLKELRL